jgi:hypothetical protein
MLFKEIIAVCSENDTKPTHTLRGQTAKLWNVKVRDTYTYYWVKNGLYETVLF